MLFRINTFHEMLKSEEFYPNTASVQLETIEEKIMLNLNLYGLT
jgi:hypothetical protein